MKLTPEEVLDGDTQTGAPGDGAPAVKGHPKFRAAACILAMAVGFFLFVFSMKGFLHDLKLEQADYGPSASYDPSYEAAVLASPEEFEAVNAERRAARGLTDMDTVAQLQGEVTRLSQEAAEAKSDAAAMEQELTNAKVLLDASTAREAQLQGALDTLSAGEPLEQTE